MRVSPLTDVGEMPRKKDGFPEGIQICIHFGVAVHARGPRII